MYIYILQGYLLAHALFLVMTTTALVAFTLRETHIRILRFTLHVVCHHLHNVHMYRSYIHKCMYVCRYIYMIYEVYI